MKLVFAQSDSSNAQQVAASLKRGGVIRKLTVMMAQMR